MLTVAQQWGHEHATSHPGHHPAGPLNVFSVGPARVSGSTAFGPNTSDRWLPELAFGM
jgi:hypothetical protein